MGVNDVVVDGGDTVSFGNVDELERARVRGKLKLDGGLVDGVGERRGGRREVTVKVDGVAICDLKFVVRSG